MIDRMLIFLPARWSEQNTFKAVQTNAFNLRYNRIKDFFIKLRLLHPGNYFSVAPFSIHNQ